MITNEINNHETEIDTKVTYGMWVYILTDCIMFACLFASFVVLRENTYGSIGINDVATLPFVLVQTMIIIVASFLFGLGYIQSKLVNKMGTIACLIMSFIMYGLFVFLQYNSLESLVLAGYTWKTSGFLSIYFIITVMFAVHVVAALIWSAVLAIQMAYAGVSVRMSVRMRCLNLYCNYLTLIWVFIFTIVYLMRSI